MKQLLNNSPGKHNVFYLEEEDENYVSSSVESSPNKQSQQPKVWKCPKCSFFNDIDQAICSNDANGGCCFNMEFVENQQQIIFTHQEKDIEIANSMKVTNFDDKINGENLQND